MSIDTLKAEVASEFGTPAVVIDLDRVEANIARVQKLCDQAGVANRPHIKTHKSPVLAKMQVAAGARGITCQKLGEAEVMVDGGLDDILISYNILGEEKVARLGRLLQRAEITVAADNPITIAGLPKAGEIAGRPLGVIIECDTGRKRAGVETAREAIELAALIKAEPHLSFRGFLFYPTETSWPQTQRFFEEATAGIRALGLEARIVSTGGTPNLVNLGGLEGATEHRAGTYIFNDRMMLACGAATPDDCALNVYATVVSRAAPGARHPRQRLQDADCRHRRPQRRLRPDPGVPAGQDRRLRGGARLPRPLAQQCATQGGRGRARGAQPRVRGRQYGGPHDRRARRQDRRCAACGSAGAAGVGELASRAGAGPCTPAGGTPARPPVFDCTPKKGGEFEGCPLERGEGR